MIKALKIVVKYTLKLTKMMTPKDDVVLVSLLLTLNILIFFYCLYFLTLSKKLFAGITLCHSPPKVWGTFLQKSFSWVQTFLDKFLGCLLVFAVEQFVLHGRLTIISCQGRVLQMHCPVI